jgi:hypothetical protein
MQDQAQPLPTEPVNDIPEYYRDLPPDAMRSQQRLPNEPYDMYRQRIKQINAMDKQRKGGWWHHLSTSSKTIQGLKPRREGQTESEATDTTVNTLHKPKGITYVKPK